VKSKNGGDLHQSKEISDCSLLEEVEMNVSITSIQAKLKESAVQHDESAQVVIRNELSKVEPYVARDFHHEGQPEPLLTWTLKISTPHHVTV